MDMMCGSFRNIVTAIYNTCVRNLDNSTKVTIGVSLLIASLLTFVLCTKGHNKSQMVNSWFLFWISLILFGVSVCYLSVFLK